MTKTKKRRRQRNAAEWFQLIEEWQQSGVAAGVFASQHDVGLSSFYKWRARLERPEPALTAKSFVPVEIVGKQRENVATGGGMDVIALSGRVIRLSGRVDPVGLALVLEVAEQC